ncbi:hypothetical protein K445DRAFT_29250, partial [Daldinia sp. EC12]
FAITEAARTGNAELVQKLLNQVSVDEEELQQALFWAAANTNTDIIDSLIGKIPNVKCFGWPKNLIFRAAAAGHPVLIRELLKRGASVNVPDSQGRRAIHFACMAWTNDSLQALAEAGADVNVKDKFGRMPVHFAAGSPNGQCLKYLLENFNDIDINAVDHDNWTPLMWAARSGFTTAITELLSREAD